MLQQIGFTEGTLRMKRNRMLLRSAIVNLSIAASTIGVCHTSTTYGQDKVQAKQVSAQRTVPAQTTNATTDASLPAIVATVDGESITRDELAALCLARHGENVLDNVINKTLILQACEAQNIKITQKDVDDEVARTAEKFRLNTNTYLKLIEDQRGVTPEMYIADVVWPMMALRQLAKDNVVVDPKEIEKEIEAEYGKKIQVRMIAMKDAAKANDVYAKAVAAPGTFEELAKQFSEDPTSASVGGLLPPIRKYNDKNDMVEQIAFSLLPDQVSNVFQVGDLHVMLQCVRHLEPSLIQAGQREAIEAHYREQIADEQIRSIADNMFENLRKQASVQILLNDAQLSPQYPGVAAILNTRPIMTKTLEDECIKRHGPEVLETEINRRVLSKAVAASNISIEQADLNAELEYLADFYGFVKADRTPDVAMWMEEVRSQNKIADDIYMSDAIWPSVALKKLVAGKVQITEEDLKIAFARDYGERAEILAIVCSNQRTAQEVWDLARNNPTDAFFGELASQYSVEPTSRTNFGKVPPVRQMAGQPTLEQAAFGLKVGELSSILQIGGQYVILRGQGRTEPVTRDINAVRSELTKYLTQKKFDQAMNDCATALFEEATIDNFLVPKAKLGKAAMQSASLQDATKK
jgi:parvulin-like peptidyl-prolyl isomerase